MSVILVQRESDILGRSNLACLANIASINLTGRMRARMHLLLYAGICQYAARCLRPGLCEHSDETARELDESGIPASGLLQFVE